MALTDLTRISTSGIATGTSLSGAILHGDAHFRGTQVGVTSALFDSSDDALEFSDNVKLTFGDSGDLLLYHTGNNSIIKDQGSGSLSLQSNGTEIALYNSSNDKYMGKFANNAQVELYYAGNPKFQTTSTGSIVTGILTATSFSGPLVGNTNNTSGLSTFYDLRVSNNLTVEGTTTTLDTNLIGVDRVEVGANSNTLAGIAVTQSGAADIVRLFDGSTQVVTVDDTGNVGIGSTLPSSSVKLDVAGKGRFSDDLIILNGKILTLLNDANTANVKIDCDGGARLNVKSYDKSVIQAQENWGIRFFQGNETERFAIDSTGGIIVGAGGTMYIPDKIIHYGDNDTAIRFPSADTIQFETGGSNKLSIGSSITSTTAITIYNADPELTFRDSNHSPYYYSFKGVGGAFNLSDSVNGDRMRFSANGSASVVAPVFVMTGAAQVSTNLGVTGNLILSDQIQHDGDTNTRIRFPGNDQIQLETAGTSWFNLGSTGAFNLGNNSNAGAKVYIKNGNDDANNTNALALDIQGAWMRIGDAILGNETFNNGVGIKFHNSGTVHWTAGTLSTGFYISNTSNNGNQLFPSTRTDALFLSSTGNATFTGNIYADNYFGNGGLTLNNNGNPSINLTSTSTTGSSRINFGDPDSTTVGKIYYVHDGDYMQFSTAYAERLRIGSNGSMYLGYNASDGLPVQDGSIPGNLRLFSIHGTGTSLGIKLTNSTTGTTTGDGVDIRLHGQTAMINQNETYDLQLQSKGELAFRTGSTPAERLRITSTGNITFGVTDTPTAITSAAIKYISGGRDYWNSTKGDYRALRLRVYDNGGNIDDQYGVGVSSGELELQSQQDIGFYAGSAGSTTGRRVLRFRLDQSAGSLDFETNTKLYLKGTANNPQRHASINIGSYGNASETRAIDMWGSWGAGENKSISFNHGANTSNLVGQINCIHTSPGSSLRWGKLYHSGDSNTYTMTLDSTSTTGANLTLYNGNLKVASGHGIDFSATANGGSGTPSELLDDYEEGYFAPTVRNLSSGYGSGTFYNRQARYTKVGNMVTCWVHLQWWGVATTTDNSGNAGGDNLELTIEGFPFEIDGVGYSGSCGGGLQAQSWRFSGSGFNNYATTSDNVQPRINSAEEIRFGVFSHNSITGQVTQKSINGYAPNIEFVFTVRVTGYK